MLFLGSAKFKSCKAQKIWTVELTAKLPSGKISSWFSCENLFLNIFRVWTEKNYHLSVTKSLILSWLKHFPRFLLLELFLSLEFSLWVFFIGNMYLILLLLHVLQIVSYCLPGCEKAKLRMNKYDQNIRFLGIVF